MRWLRRFVSEFEKRWNRYARMTGRSWCVDETYVKIRGLSITRDGYAVPHRAVREMPAEDIIWKDMKLRSSKYLNNMLEQDHRGVKSRIAPKLGFKVFNLAAMMIADIKLLHRIRKEQFVLDHLGVQGQAAPAIWTAVLAT